MERSTKRPGEDDIDRANAKIMRGHSESDLMEVGRRMAKNSGDSGGAFHGDNMAIDDVNLFLDVAMATRDEDQTESASKDDETNDSDSKAGKKDQARL